jgi:hypothetical protein
MLYRGRELIASAMGGAEDVVHARDRHLVSRPLRRREPDPSHRHLISPVTRAFQKLPEQPRELPAGVVHAVGGGERDRLDQVGVLVLKPDEGVRGIIERERPHPYGQWSQRDGRCLPAEQRNTRARGVQVPGQ